MGNDSLLCSGDSVCRAMAACASSAVLISPFIKLSAFLKVTAGIKDALPLTVVTRWRPEEVAAGVSDLEVADACGRRQAAKLLLLNNLHSKYFRVDDSVFIGSANLTNAGLGWSAWPNEEIIYRTRASPELLALESRILGTAMPATDEIRRAIALAVQMISPPSAAHQEDAQPIDESFPRRKTWIPSCRAPASLLRTYRGGSRSVTRASHAAATADLIALGIPPGLEDQDFLQRLRLALQMTPFYQRMAELSADSPRFGQLKRRFAAEFSSSRDPSVVSDELQTSIRWLVHFFPDQYRIRVYRFTEHLERKT
jgi:hypothetical protein